MNRKQLVAAGMAMAMTASWIGGCSNNQAGASADAGNKTSTNTEGGQTAQMGASGDEVVKPEKIKIMVDGSVMTKMNDRDAFERRWEELTGIELEITQPDHDAYYDVLGQTFASGTENWPDAIILSNTYYSGYAEEGALWDMTDTWEASDLRASQRVIGEDVIDGMRLNGRLFGFPVNRGNGCVTYVKKEWLDNCGLDAPTTYEEYINMLDAFTNGDPDGNGVNGDTYGLSAAGFIGGEAPYTNFLPEFYQDAYPSFLKDDDGVWYDGFTEENFKDALTRIREAYAAGYIDKETLTNGTSDCRNKFYEGKYGVFTYWAGAWTSNLKNNLEANGLNGELVALEPIQEVGTYVERNPPIWAITTACDNPEGVYKYLIESMLDGGDMQLLWTYGVEDVHWSTKAEEILGNTYAEGEFHLTESIEKPGTQYTKQHLDPMLSLVVWEGDPGKNVSAPEATNSQLVFNNNCHQANLVFSTEEMTTYNGDLMTLKNSIIAEVIVQGVSIEDAYARFEKEGGSNWSKQIVDSLNQ